MDRWEFHLLYVQWMCSENVLCLSTLGGWDVHHVLESTHSLAYSLTCTRHTVIYDYGMSDYVTGLAEFNYAILLHLWRYTSSIAIAFCLFIKINRDWYKCTLNIWDRAENFSRYNMKLWWMTFEASWKMQSVEILYLSLKSKVTWLEHF